MSRAPRAVPSHARRKKVFKQAKGFYGRRKNTITSANAAVDRSLQHNYIGRKLKKRNFRALWIQRINAGLPRARPHLQPIYQRARQGRASRSTARCSPISPSTSPTPSRLWWIRPARKAQPYPLPIRHRRLPAPGTSATNWMARTSRS